MRDSPVARTAASTFSQRYLPTPGSTPPMNRHTPSEVSSTALRPAPPGFRSLPARYPTPRSGQAPRLRRVTRPAHQRRALRADPAPLAPARTCPPGPLRPPWTRSPPPARARLHRRTLAPRLPQAAPGRSRSWAHRSSSAQAPQQLPSVGPTRTNWLCAARAGQQPRQRTDQPCYTESD